MLAKTHAAQVVGLQADIVDIEVDVSRGLHSFSLVGLPDQAVEEARDRIAAAVKNSGFKSPLKSNKKIIVSLAPADLKKEGPVFDLGIALTYLLATEEIAFNPADKIFLGELALDGTLRPIKGVLISTQAARSAGFTEIYLPAANAHEAALIRDITVYPCQNLKELIEHLTPGEENRPPRLTAQPPTEIATKGNSPEETLYDLADIKGQETAKRGLEIAAAGGHNLAMYGPPGTGKTMLAKAFAGLLPPLSFEEAVEITGIHSAAGTLTQSVMIASPFRSPHHTASYIALVGGGNWPRPGEITLAHRGVLFLDEFPEFEKRVIESLRQPLEDRVVTISRARGSLTFPANFILIAAMNHCPCGNRGLRYRECLCSPAALQRYQRKLSGPIVDRIDLWLEVGPVEHAKLSGNADGESSAAIRQKVQAARDRQLTRFQKHHRPFRTNSEMGVRDLKRFAPLTNHGYELLNQAAKQLDLSARAYHRIIKLARTIADLAGQDDIAEEYLLEALQYRPRALYT